jgi:hypothetical protein
MVGNDAWNQEVQDWVEQNYPGLIASGYRITSPDTIDYNCVAWAANDSETWWWPDPLGQDYWPATVPREETVGAFILAFGTIGYQICKGFDLDVGFQKIALYTDNTNTPTHVARQLPDGRWASKLGSSEDIEHPDLQGLEGEPGYGTVTVILKRPIS